MILDSFRRIGCSCVLAGNGRIIAHMEARCFCTICVVFDQLFSLQLCKRIVHWVVSFRPILILDSFNDRRLRLSLNIFRGKLLFREMVADRFCVEFFRYMGFYDNWI